MIVYTASRILKPFFSKKMNKIIPAILNINVDAGGLFPYTGDNSIH